jgi:hypothetical protein
VVLGVLVLGRRGASVFIVEGARETVSSFKIILRRVFIADLRRRAGLLSFEVVEQP